MSLRSEYSGLIPSSVAEDKEEEENKRDMNAQLTAMFSEAGKDKESDDIVGSVGDDTLVGHAGRDALEMTIYPPDQIGEGGDEAEIEADDDRLPDPTILPSPEGGVYEDQQHQYDKATGPEMIPDIASEFGNVPEGSWPRKIRQWISRDDIIGESGGYSYEGDVPVIREEPKTVDILPKEIWNEGDMSVQVVANKHFGGDGQAAYRYLKALQKRKKLAEIKDVDPIVMQDNTTANYIKAIKKGQWNMVEGMTMITALGGRILGGTHVLTRNEDTIGPMYYPKPLRWSIGLGYKRQIAELQKKMKANHVSSLRGELDNPSLTKEERAKLDHAMKWMNAVEGENFFAELFNQLFVDYKGRLKGIEDVSNFGNVFFGQAVLDSVEDYTRNALVPIYKKLEIPLAQRNSFYEGLTFGSSMFGFGVIPRVTFNMFKLGAVLTREGTRYIAKVGMPNVQEGSKIYNMLKRIDNKRFAEHTDDVLKSVALQQGPWVASQMHKQTRNERIKSLLLPRETLNSDFKMAIGAGAGMAAGAEIFGGGEMEPLKYLFGLTGGFAGAMSNKYSWYNPAKPFKATTRAFAGLLFVATNLAYKGLNKLKMTHEGAARVTGVTNLWLHHNGFSMENITKLSVRARTEYEAMIKKFGEEEGTRKAKEIGLVWEAHDGSTILNKDFFKKEVMGTTEKELALYEQAFTELGESAKDNPALRPFLEDMRAMGRTADDMLTKLATGFEPAAGSAMTALEIKSLLAANVSDIIYLSTWRNYQAVMISKLQLGIFGGFKKGQLISELDKIQRVVDARMDAYLADISKLKINKDAQEIHKNLQRTLKDYGVQVAESNQRSRTVIDRWLSQMKNDIHKQYSSSTLDKLRAKEKAFSMGEFGVDSSVGKLDRFTYLTDDFLFGAKDDAGIWMKTTIPYLNSEMWGNYSREGVYTKLINTNRANYAEAYAKAERGDGVFIDASQLYRNSKADIKTEIMSKEAQRYAYRGATEPPRELRASFRLRGIERKYKEFVETYGEARGGVSFDNFLNAQINKHKINFNFGKKDSPNPTKDKIDALLKHDSDIPDIPVLMSIREFNGIRSYLTQVQSDTYKAAMSATNRRHTPHYQAGVAVNDFNSVMEEALKNAKKGDKLLEVKKELDTAEKFWNENVLPWRQSHLSRGWLSQKNEFFEASPENYFMGFFTEGTSNSLLKNRKVFDVLFKNEKGKYDETALELLHQGLGRAFNHGLMDDRLPAVLGMWKPVFQQMKGGKQIIKHLDEQIILKNSHLTGTDDMLKKQIDDIDTARNALATQLENMADSRIAILAGSSMGRLASPIGHEVLGANAKDMVKMLRGDSPLEERAKLVDFLLGEGHIGQRDALLNTTAAKDLAVLRERIHDIETLGGITREAKDALIEEAKRIQSPLRKSEWNAPSIVDEAALHGSPLQILLDSIKGHSKEEMIRQSLRDMITDELFVRHVKWVDRIKRHDAAGRDARAANRMKHKNMFFKEGEYFDPSHLKSRNFEPVMELSQELDLVQMRNAWKKHEKALSLLYDDKQFKMMTDMWNTGVAISGKMTAQAVKGMMTEVTAAMAMGRMYNAAKGVMSIRYAFMEGGFIQARKMQADMFLKMMRDPAALAIAHELFFVGKVTPTLVNKFAGILRGVLGSQLIAEEKSYLEYMILRTQDAIIGTTSWLGWRDDVDDYEQLMRDRKIERRIKYGRAKQKYRTQEQKNIDAMRNNSVSDDYQKWRNKTRQKRPITIAPQQ